MSKHSLSLSEDLTYLASLNYEQLIEVAALRGQSLAKYREERNGITQQLNKPLLPTEADFAAIKVKVADMYRHENREAQDD